MSQVKLIRAQVKLIRVSPKPVKWYDPTDDSWHIGTVALILHPEGAWEDGIGENFAVKRGDETLTERHHTLIREAHTGNLVWIRTDDLSPYEVPLEWQRTKNAQGVLE